MERHLSSATELAVRQALDKWLSDQLSVTKVTVTLPSEGRIDIEVRYELIETREAHSTLVELRA